MGGLPNQVSSQIANSQPASESMDSIIPDAIRVCKNDIAVAEAVAAVTDRFNLTVTEEGVPIRCAGNNESWVLYSDYLCLVNPFDRDTISAATQWARQEELEYAKIGVIAFSYLSQLKTKHGYVEDDTEDNVNSKLALQSVEEIIRSAALQDASDIHFQPTQTERIDILFRIDGILRVQKKIDLKLQEAMVRSVMESRCHVTLTTNTQQDGKFDFPVDQHKTINLRVSTIPVVRKSMLALKMVMRLLGNNSNLADLSKLGLSDYNKKLLRRIGSYPNGMIITTGPTGSGKTTTLSALLLDAYSSNPSRNFHTVEDPVELQHQGMSHTEVTQNLSFAQALRALLRQDPDVIMVGEMRDNETAELGFKAAMTGHLVLTTLHTNNAHESIGRLERMGLDKEIIATNTTAFLAQRLVRALCPECKIKTHLKDDPDRMAVYGKHPIFSELGGDTVVFKANTLGCKKCGEGSSKGEKGRRSIIEILEMTPSVQVPILEGENPAILRRKQIQEGSFNDLWDDGLRLLQEGIIGFEQIEAALKSFDHDRTEVNNSLGSGSSKPVPRLMKTDRPNLESIQSI